MEHTVRKSRNISQNRSPNFLMCDPNNVVEHNMEKELKSCTGVLFRADLTGHSQFSQSANFCQKGKVFFFFKIH